MQFNNYETCLLRMALFREFNHYDDNMRGIITQSLNLKLIKSYKVDYCIYSYDTLICFVDFENKVYSINPHKYSTTTSKQVGLIYRAAKLWEDVGYERILWI